MGRRTKLNPQSLIHLKSSSGNIPSFLYGKCFIQSGSVEKYSIRLKPYHLGLMDPLSCEGFSTPASSLGKAAAAAHPAMDFRTQRRWICDGALGCSLPAMFGRSFLSGRNPVSRNNAAMSLNAFNA